MLDDDVRIRPAKTEDAEELADIAWRAKQCSNCSAEEMNGFREILNVTPKIVEENPTYLLENAETEEILGFYFLEKLSDCKYWLRHICVAPEYMGTGAGGDLFLNACETAETIGVDELWILSDTNSEEFFLHMGAERSGQKTADIGGSKITLSVLRIKL